MYMLIISSAHHDAAVHPKVGRLHRDVSGGNVLMYPRVQEDNGTYYLKWTGLLADWEMSKRIQTEPGGKRRQRQPERTVCGSIVLEVRLI